MQVSVGDLVVVKSNQTKLWGEELIRGYKAFPGEYDFHKVFWVEPGFGLVIETRETFVRVLIHAYNVWFEGNQVQPESSICNTQISSMKLEKS